MSKPPRKVLHLPRVRMLSRGGRVSSSGLRITNVKSIKPPDPEAMKKLEQDRLRAELQKEIVSRSRACAYKGFECTLPALTSRQYCRRHILRDSSAPYRQCVHTSAGGDRCAQPAPLESRSARDPGLCFEHARAALLARQRSAAPPPPAASAETLLHQLQHYVRPERLRTTSCASSVSVVSDPAAEIDQSSPQPLDPFKQIDATAVNAAYSSSIIDCASASESECESVTLGPGGDCRAGPEDDLSDAEDAPCEDKPLWRAGVFTAEEAVSSAMDCLRSLQAAYVLQLGRLRALLQTARRTYLRDLKAEREQHCSISSQARSGRLTPRERRQLRKLKAHAGYHRKHGVHAVLARKLHHKRTKVNDPCPARSVPSVARCVFTEGGVRCGAHSVPASKHCLKHILYDTHQVLFRACGDARGVDACREPVAPPAACRYHAGVPPYTVFTVKMPTNSDSESEGSISEESHMEEPAATEPAPVATEVAG